MFWLPTTHLVAQQSTAKALSQRVAKQPKYFSFLLLSSSSSFSSDGLVQSTVCDKNSSILHWAACAPAHRFFTTQKSHKVVQTSHRSMGSFAMPFSSLVRMPDGYKQLLLKIAELEIRSVCMEPEMGRVDSVVEQMPCQWQVLCYHPYPCFPALCWSAIHTSHYIFNAFWSCMQYKMNHYSSILTD